LDDSASTSLEQYKTLNNYIINEYYQSKPSILECYFFPNQDNEVNVVNMLRTCKKTLDIAIFTLTNDKIYAAIEESFKRGVKVRVIADDECCKMLGSDIIKLAALGVDCKTDSNSHAHMHHKFAIIDNSVVITGSFNWTVQAVKNNQENILFYENKELANLYTQEYNRLWNLFTAVVNKEESMKKLKSEEDKKRLALEKRQAEKEQKKKEKNK
jgi:cardiolipin hydrolase